MSSQCLSRFKARIYLSFGKNYGRKTQACLSHFPIYYNVTNLKTWLVLFYLAYRGIFCQLNLRIHFYGCVGLLRGLEYMNGVIPFQQNNVLDINSMKIVTKGKRGLSHRDFWAYSYSICGRQGDEVWHSHECQTLWDIRYMLIMMFCGISALHLSLTTMNLLLVLNLFLDYTFMHD